MLKSVRYCHAVNAAMPDKFIQIREGAMVKNGLMVSAFTLIFGQRPIRTACGAVVSASWVNSSATSMNSSAAAR
jgi:hypothetical protein